VIDRSRWACLLQAVGAADVLLHPFPFGGSKTSSDGLAMGVPVVALKGPFLRSRMACVRSLARRD